MSMEWQRTERGHYLEYNGHRLEITRRRPDTFERRTFVVVVNGQEDPVPLWNLPSAKTRALRAVMKNNGQPIGRLTLKKQQEIAEQMRGQDAEVLDREPEQEPELLTEAVPEVLEPEVLTEAPGPRRVSYTVTGSFELGKLGSGYTTLETVMELLRELGTVSCTVKSPEDIEL